MVTAMGRLRQQYLLIYCQLLIIHKACYPLAPRGNTGINIAFAQQRLFTRKPWQNSEYKIVSNTIHLKLNIRLM